MNKIKILVSLILSCTVTSLSFPVSHPVNAMTSFSAEVSEDNTNEISLGNVTKDTLADASDTKTYSVKLEKKETVSVIFMVFSKEITNIDKMYQVTLYYIDSENVQKELYRFYSSDKQERKEFGVDPGTYYIKVECGKDSIEADNTFAVGLVSKDASMLKPANQGTLLKKIKATNGKVTKQVNDSNEVTYFIKLSKGKTSTTIQPILTNKDDSYTINGESVEKKKVKLESKKGMALSVAVTSQDEETTERYTVIIK